MLFCISMNLTATLFVFANMHNDVLLLYVIVGMSFLSSCLFVSTYFPKIINNRTVYANETLFYWCCNSLTIIVCCISFIRKHEIDVFELSNVSKLFLVRFRKHFYIKNMNKMPSFLWFLEKKEYKIWHKNYDFHFS
jgi:hypothetical protein